MLCFIPKALHAQENAILESVTKTVSACVLLLHFYHHLTNLLTNIFSIYTTIKVLAYWLCLGWWPPWKFVSHTQKLSQWGRHMAVPQWQKKPDFKFISTCDLNAISYYMPIVSSYPSTSRQAPSTLIGRGMWWENVTSTQRGYTYIRVWISYVTLQCRSVEKGP